ncbi:MAG: hypothetical protein J6R37_02635 [Clostridia bacterium]|nr:hypothetical protein [Clostridia bacterium]
MEILETFTVPCIATAVYVAIALLKYTTNNNAKLKRFLPLISVVLDAIAGILCFYFFTEAVSFSSLPLAIVHGASSGLTATGFDQIFRQLVKKES